jgi:hypothetical protein
VLDTEKATSNLQLPKKLISSLLNQVRKKRFFKSRIYDVLGVATIGKYPVAIYKSISFDMDKHAKNPVVTVKIRGHPAETTEEEIREFLSGLNVTRVVMNAVEIPGGRVISEVYVTFPDSQSVDAAVAKDREKIGSRWVSVR